MHLLAAKRLLRYLEGSLHFALTFPKPTVLDLVYYYDAYWSSNLDDRRNTNAYFVYFGNYVVSWLSSKQKVVLRSSTESEYRAMAMAYVGMI